MRLLAKLILIISLSATQIVGHAQQSGGKVDIKVYMAQDESARRVAERLLLLFGRKLVGNAIPGTPLSGKFEVRSIDEAMSYFRSAYNINWYENGVNVYVYASSDWRVSRIYVGGDQSIEAWVDLMTSAGLAYKQFPYVFHPESKELVVSGPASYLSLVEKAFGQKKPDPSEIEKHGIDLMVFPLKHASVEDRITELRGRTILTPGALTVLLNLLGLPPQRIAMPGEDKRAGQVSEASPMQNPSGALLMTDRAKQMPIPTGKFVPPSKQGTPENPDTPPISVTGDPRTNAILVRDAKSKFAYYKKLIDELDRPVSMIEVEAMMVDVDQSALNELGLEFGLITKSLLYDFPGTAVGRPRVTLPQGASSIVDPSKFLARLKALEANENAKVLARPTILTQDNVSAYIDLSETIYLQLTGERVAEALPITAGSLLQVTPRLVVENSEEKIFLRVEIQDGALLDTMQGIDMPRVKNTSISTQALIFREKAILIGGYNREVMDTTEYKVPVLGSLPFIGKAFSSNSKRTQTLARLFLITPRLVDGATHDHESTRGAVKQLQRSFKLNSDNLEPTPSLRVNNSLRVIP